ncbi:MAG TPA: hypothetical protein VMS09_08900 [Paenibacillus sp.]|uniref:hypothetical protein n=1 Tax=Paenibacillus sp. TaxID=58172 RepID=UPI0028D1D0D0|nr:hypothetical protein [Paenibacillus sp.]HUC92131.1 hypothetical protein [Paenibacillus sp.]
MRSKDKQEAQEPTIAPGMDDALDAEANAREKRAGDSTEVTRLALDRTPED